MILDPIVIAVIKAEDGSVELTLDVPPDLTHFAGHFPAHPLLPGVIEVDWAVRLAETHFALPRQRFSQLRNVKFTRPIRPGERLVCRLAWEAAAGRLSFAYTCAGQPCASGQLEFTADAPHPPGAAA